MELPWSFLKTARPQTAIQLGEDAHEIPQSNQKGYALIMPLTREEYACVNDFSVLYSGGLDSCAVPLIIGATTPGQIELLTFMHSYGTFFNEWSKRHTPELQRVLGERVQHHLIDLTETWNEVGAKKFFKDALKYRGHWVGCLGCQESMATHTIVHNLERTIANAFICSSVGGEYAAMSMSVTREKNAEFYARYGIRYNAPLLDLGISKPEERAVLAQHEIEAGWGARRSHQGFQPICALGFQHALDIVFDWHTTYPPDRVGNFLDEKFKIMDIIIRRTLESKGIDPDEAIEKTKAIYDAEEIAMEQVREQQAAEIA
jgi:hypothetical protein